MKFLDKFALILFSNIVLILSIVLCLMLFGWVDVNFMGELFKTLVTNDTASKITLGVCIVLILLALKSILFSSYGSNSKSGQGVLMENESGKLMISKETLENLVYSVTRSFHSLQDVHVKVELDIENNISVYLNATVDSTTIIKDLSVKLQNEIKNKIKETTDLDIKEVNIQIKNVAPKEKE